ncbi:MAG: SDR family NAD(P)-dependent oxidoreductase [Acidimicrobiia bacterium]
MAVTPATTDIVVVTGTSSGLGAAIAEKLLAEGYRVVGVARREVSFSSGYEHVRADLSDLDAIPALAREIITSFGKPYGLINNAASGIDGLLPTMHNSEINAVIGLDLTSPILLSKYLCRPMISKGRGRIVNVSSIVARTGFRGLAVYAAAKAGLEGFTRSLSRELGPRGVTVNCVAPGFIDTPMTNTLSGTSLDRIKSRSPLGRFASPGEVAAAVSYLLSPAADGVTGSVLTVDAGSTA